MRHTNGKLLFSSSDLITFMESSFASALERQKLTNPDIAKLVDAKNYGDQLLNIINYPITVFPFFIKA